jgi:hypothetical protein
MRDRLTMAAGNRLALVLLLMAIVTPVSAETEAERLSGLQAESEWVWKELKVLSVYDDAESRSRLESEVERLEEERAKLLRLVPESIDVEELLADLSERAADENLELEASDPEMQDHEGYRSVTVRLTLEGDPKAVSRFIRRLQLSRSVRWVRRIERPEPVEQVEVTAFMISPETVGMRSCAIPPTSPEESERESALRERLLSRCAELDAVDPELRRMVQRRLELMDWINLTARLTLDKPPLEPVEEQPVEDRRVMADVNLDEMPADIDDILAEPPR